MFATPAARRPWAALVPTLKLATLKLAFALLLTLAAAAVPAQTVLLPKAAPAAVVNSATGAGAGTAAGAVVITDQVRAELMAHAPQGIEPGKPVWLGLQITHKPEWHTYWKNPGDSGLPTQLEWTLPAGVSAGDIAWPMPHKIPIGTLANYGYEGRLLLPVPLTVSPDFKSRELDVTLRAAWLVCRKECIPEEGEFRLRVPARGSVALNAADFDAAMAAQPRDLSADAASRIRLDGGGKQLAVTVRGLPAAWGGKDLEFFPETSDVIVTAAAIRQQWKGGDWTAQVPVSDQRAASPGVMPVVLKLGEQGVRVALPVADPWPAASTQQPAGVPPALEQALKDNARQAAAASSVPPSLWAALLGALIGGLILNLMPCVFPVLAIKVVAFARHADDRAAHRVAGLAYTAGVVLSFVALGALMLGLRSAGEAIGWGFQLQNPWVVAALAALFTVIGLNLAGLFEFGSMLPSPLAGLQARHPAADAALSGVLAVAVASPCTAPFMGASMGLAVSLPAVQALLVFGTVGLGMALPYLAASWVPALARALPRPGAWMDVFRRAMAFPMFATVVWLVWVLGQQSGIDGAGALLGLLVALAALIWALGTLRERARWVVGSLVVAVSVWALWALGPEIAREPPATDTASAQQRDGAIWQPWTPGKVDQLLAQGRPVFVDFTAAWCVTCQYNKKTTLADSQVLADFEQRGVVLLRADWTRRDPAITAALAALGRNGVPVYVIYKKGAAPVVLSEVLSVEGVRSEIARL